VLLAELFLAFQRTAALPSNCWEPLAKEHSVSLQKAWNLHSN